MSGFNVGEWLGQILEYLSISVDMKIQIGFSFVGVKYKKLVPSYIYFFAAPDLCQIKKTFRFPADALKFALDLESQTYRQFLQQTFLKTQSGEVFESSGIGPFVLVACYIWITK